MDSRMDIDFEALMRSFLAESDDGLAQIEEALMVLERRPRDDQALGIVFRVAHSIKGNAAMFEFGHVERLAHVVEELLERLRERSLEVTGELVTLLLHAVDALREMIPEAADGRGEMPPAARAVLAELKRLATREGAIDREKAEAAEVEAPRPTAPGRRGRTLRVDLDRLDRLLTLTGEIGIARGRLVQMLEDPAVSRAAVLETLREADLVHLELQELVMKLRMVPVGPTFRRYRRTVRDLAKSHGKVARLAIEGEEVEVDATVIENLRDPLTHMVRNALDHGIEPPEARSAVGKDPCGLVTLKAWHEAGTIVIELSDDGAGLDRERILKRARAAGSVPPAPLRGDEPDGGGLTEQEIEKLIFEPGFTTAEAVTDLSGRGVGMDVVRRNIEALRGSVAITSRSGEGTTITVRLPLTLAIIDGLTVGVAGETFFIPLETVVESVELPPEERRSDGCGVINLRGTTLPYVRLRNLFRLEGAAPARENVVVVESRRQQLAGLVVDALQSQTQAVIKPLAKLFRDLPGISASTILGNGCVALILDVPGLLSQAVNGNRRQWISKTSSQATHPNHKRGKQDAKKDILPTGPG